jgi:hypothetical protein
MTLRDRAIEALLRAYLTPADREVAASIFDANHPRLVWVSDDPSGMGGMWGNGNLINYQVRPVAGGSWKWCAVTSGRWYIDASTLAAAQAAAEAHYITQRLQGTALWKAMEDMG